MKRWLALVSMLVLVSLVGLVSLLALSSSSPTPTDVAKAEVPGANGRIAVTGSEYSGGAVSQIRLYDRPLTADEVAALACTELRIPLGTRPCQDLQG